MKDLSFILVLGAILIALFIFLIIVCVLRYKKQSKEEAIANNSYSGEINKYETKEFTVKVIDQCCRARMVGVKYPKSIEEYFVSFEKVDGEILNLSVPKECYDGFEVGQSGVLTLVDGDLYSFIPEKEVTLCK